jgi:hypothetical protein
MQHDLSLEVPVWLRVVCNWRLLDERVKKRKYETSFHPRIAPCEDTLEFSRENWMRSRAGTLIDG